MAVQRLAAHPVATAQSPRNSSRAPDRAAWFAPCGWAVRPWSGATPCAGPDLLQPERARPGSLRCAVSVEPSSPVLHDAVARRLQPSVGRSPERLARHRSQNHNKIGRAALRPDMGDTTRRSLWSVIDRTERW